MTELVTGCAGSTPACRRHPRTRPGGFRHRAFTFPQRDRGRTGVNSDGHGAAGNSTDAGRAASHIWASYRAVDTRRPSPSSHPSPDRSRRPAAPPVTIAPCIRQTPDPAGMFARNLRLCEIAQGSSQNEVFGRARLRPSRGFPGSDGASPSQPRQKVRASKRLGRSRLSSSEGVREARAGSLVVGCSASTGPARACGSVLTEHPTNEPSGLLVHPLRAPDPRESLRVERMAQGWIVSPRL